MAAVQETKRKYSDEIRELGLERHVLELEVDGLTVVPPEVHGVDIARIDELGQRILEEAKNLTGVDFDLDNGPRGELQFPKDSSRRAKLAGAKEDFQPSQFIIQQLGRIHRMFRDLAINPVAIALIRHLIGKESTRFNSHNSFIKWQGEFGYGPTLGLHCDQGGVPLSMWRLFAGALALVPGSYKRARRPTPEESALSDEKCNPEAVCMDISPGDAVVWHGSTWHGSFARQVPGIRMNLAVYFARYNVVTQERHKDIVPQEVLDRHSNDARFKRLLAGDLAFGWTREGYDHSMKRKKPRGLYD